MQTIDEIYRKRLKLLAAEFGSQKALTEHIDKSPAQLSQWINASKDANGRRRVMDRTTAREIELKCNKPTGWMDQPIGETLSERDRDAAPTKEVPSLINLFDLVDQLGAALGAIKPEQRASAVDLCTTLAKAPDSRSVRRELAGLLASNAAERPWSWREAAATMADMWPTASERPMLQRFLETVDGYLASEVNVARPATTRSK